MDWDAIQAAIFSWAQDASGLQCIWDEQNAPSPSDPYCKLKLTGPTPIGQDEVRPVLGSATDFQVIGRRKLQLSVNIYGKGAFARAATMQTALSLPSVHAAFDRVNVAVCERGPARDLTKLVETRFEQRAQFDVTLHAVDTAIDKPGLIERVKASGAVGGVDIDIDTDPET